MAKHPLWRVYRAAADLARELKRLDEETFESIGAEAIELYDGLLDLLARLAELGGAPAEQVAAMRAGGDDDDTGPDRG